MRFVPLIRSVIHINTNLSQTAYRTFATVNQPLVAPESSLSFADSVLVLSLKLPSRQETCRFHLNLQTATVGQLINDIKLEDSGIEHVHVHDDSGHLLATSYSLNSLLTSPFTIQLNKQRTFLFDPLKKLQVKDSGIRQNLADGTSVENTVTALYHALHIMKQYHNKHIELKQEANELTAQLEPLEKIKEKLAKICQRHTSRYVWYGLGAMSFQVGILAELTWDVYSWDIVEPISYFLAFATAMSVYAFHLMTRADFEYMTMTDRLFLRQFYREARRHAFDISLYNRLKNRLFIIHTDLARLRAPLSLSLPVPPNPLKCKISGEELSPLNIYRARRNVE